MNIKFALAAVAIAAFSSAAMASSITGAGGPIPPSGTGGGGTWNNGNPTAMPTAPFMSSVMLTEGIASVQSITFTDLAHTWIGDLQAVLFDPNGVGHNIFVRPGVGDGGSTVGSNTNFLGTYTFVESGAPNNLPVVSGGDTLFNQPSGMYNQTFAGSPTAMGSWEDGAQNIFNTPMSMMSGEAGEWTLFIYDWAGGDVGSLGSWTLNYTAVPAPGALALLGLAGLAATRRRRS
jgi:MYXO-CTERM domain-containing protein